MLNHSISLHVHLHTSIQNLFIAVVNEVTGNSFYNIQRFLIKGKSILQINRGVNLIKVTWKVHF